MKPGAEVAIPRVFSVGLTNSFPRRIQAGGSPERALVIEMDMNRFATVDQRRQMKMVEGAGAVDLPVKGGWVHVGGIFDWQMAGDFVVAYGDFYRGNKDELTNWSSGFMRFPVSSSPGIPSEVQILSQRKLRAPERIFYRLGYPMIAAVGETAYAVTVDKGMGIYRFASAGQPAEPLKAFPKELAGRPAPLLPDLLSRADVPVVMQAIEKSLMPAGLFGWDGYLYLVFRVPEREGSRWMISRIDPKPGQERVVGTAVLMTRANDLTIVPGPDHWAVLVKAAVRDFRNELEQVRLIPSERFRFENLRGDLCQ